jgi:tRNA-Thr(GGU) m(6)t(6)A37 methyltransferase TsaA
MTPFSLAPIGHVESPVLEPVDQDWGKVTSRIVMLPGYGPGLQGLGAFSHAIVLTWLHRASFDPTRHLVRRPRGLASMPEVGIFAQRAKDRPNPIGVTAVSVLRVEPDAVVVSGLDAINGTPVIDIKPYYPQYDAVDAPRVPEWVNELMRGYF